MLSSSAGDQEVELVTEVRKNQAIGVFGVRVADTVCNCVRAIKYHKTRWLSTSRRYCKRERRVDDRFMEKEEDDDGTVGS